MTTIIKIKNSVQSGKAPTPADLDRAELAINLADKKIYTKDANDAIIELGGGGGGGGSASQAVYVGSTFKGTPKEGDLWLFKPHVHDFGKIDIKQPMTLKPSDLEKNDFFLPKVAGYAHSSWQAAGLPNYNILTTQFIVWDGSKWIRGRKPTIPNPHYLGSLTGQDFTKSMDMAFKDLYNKGTDTWHPNVRNGAAELQVGDFISCQYPNQHLSGLWFATHNSWVADPPGDGTNGNPGLKSKANTYYIWNGVAWTEGPTGHQPAFVPPPPEFRIYKNSAWEAVGTGAGGGGGPTHFIKTTDPAAGDGADGDIWFKVV